MDHTVDTGRRSTPPDRPKRGGAAPRRLAFNPSAAQISENHLNSIQANSELDDSKRYIKRLRNKRE